MLKEVETTRIGWMGSQEWKRRAVVDVVRESALESVVSRRKIEIEALAKRLAGTLEKMRHKLKEKSRTSMVLRVSPADRGISGFPSLLKSLAANSRNFRWEKPDD